MTAPVVLIGLSRSPSFPTDRNRYLVDLRGGFIVQEVSPLLVQGTKCGRKHFEHQ